MDRRREKAHSLASQGGPITIPQRRRTASQLSPFSPRRWLRQTHSASYLPPQHQLRTLPFRYWLQIYLDTCSKLYVCNLEGSPNRRHSIRKTVLSRYFINLFLWFALWSSLSSKIKTVFKLHQLSPLIVRTTSIIPFTIMKAPIRNITPSKVSVPTCLPVLGFR